MVGQQKIKFRVIGVYLMGVANGLKAFFDTVAELDEDDKVETINNGFEQGY